MQNAINGTGNGGTTKPEIKSVKLNTLGVDHYGEYVKYDIPESIGHGPDENAHKTDWRIFYNDGTYVYLIASYYLLNSKLPEGTGMTGYEGKPYTSYWTSFPETYIPITDDVRTHYKMSWNKSTTNPNIKAVSTLLDTSKWMKFVNTTYALDAIASPTIEMWIESWNSKGNTKLYCNNSNEYGFYVGTENTPTRTATAIGDATVAKDLYYPVTESTASDENGYRYWFSSPSAYNQSSLMGFNYQGYVGNSNPLASGNEIALRPVVRMKSDVMVKQNTSGVWELQ